MTTHRVQPSRCPWCNALNDSATNVLPGEAIRPDDGAAALCLYCGEWSIFESSQLRKPTPDEFIELGTDKDCQIARAAWMQTR
jgi:hypothetical protein